ncbi:DUF4258 domain-containing protein [Streptomonospora sp. PA3]|uniref:DUF4258 domain-containing protein n=1 Tax=Streptomonospora sp. PA3 TaxID=2607326 RepID=UPI0012DCA9D1|nr:DUF4258 domain-containing protein [Streptomonospora sp. PA3]MUL43586.1 DUF4258 domain-containing protein [Streptomonospora sp. PA3]
MPPRFTHHLRERLRKRKISEADVQAVVARPVNVVHDPQNRSYKLFGWTGDGRRIYVAVREDSWGTGDPVLKTAVEVS